MMHDLSLGSTLMKMFQDAFRYDFRHPDSVIISAYETMGTKTFVEVGFPEDICLQFLLPTDYQVDRRRMDTGNRPVLQL